MSRTIRLVLAATLMPVPLAAQEANQVILPDLPLTAALVGAVTGADPTPIFEGEVDPHSASLRPSQARRLSNADLVVTMGAGLMPTLDGPLAQLPADRVVALADMPGVHLIELSDAHAHGDEHDDDHAETHGDEGEHDADHAEHADESGDHGAHDHAGGLDPHVWLDPENAALWLTALADRLAEDQPGRADAFTAAANESAARITATADEVRARIDDSGATMLAGHDAWAYAEEALGLPVVAAIADSEADAPGAAGLSEVTARIEAGDITCLLVAPNDPRAQVDRLAADHGLPIVEAAPFGDSAATGIDRYLSVLTGLAEAAEACAP